MWEQISLADVYVHYDDVQFSKGHYVNRVQIKTADGSRWMTIPVLNNKLGTLINELQTDDRKDWRASHRALVAGALAGAPYVDSALQILDDTYAVSTTSLAEVVITGLDIVATRLGFRESKKWLYSSQMGIEGRSSQRVLDIVKAADGDVYITGQGAKNYLDHELFERNGVEVRYMDYAKEPYPQQHGDFTPSVSVLDLIANTGPAARDYVLPRTLSWRDFLESP